MLKIPVTVMVVRERSMMLGVRITVGGAGGGEGGGGEGLVGVRAEAMAAVERVGEGVGAPGKL